MCVCQRRRFCLRHLLPSYCVTTPQASIRNIPLLLLLLRFVRRFCETCSTTVEQPAYRYLLNVVVSAPGRPGLRWAVLVIVHHAA
jgi:hypothetical protein